MSTKIVEVIRWDKHIDFVDARGGFIATEDGIDTWFFSPNEIQYLPAYVVGEILEVVVDDRNPTDHLFDPEYKYIISMSRKMAKACQCKNEMCCLGHCSRPLRWATRLKNEKAIKYLCGSCFLGHQRQGIVERAENL
jgi:hypothetical protein